MPKKQPVVPNNISQKQVRPPEETETVPLFNTAPGRQEHLLQDPAGLLHLQDQVGNLATQEWLAQMQGATPQSLPAEAPLQTETPTEEAALPTDSQMAARLAEEVGEEPVEVGEIHINDPQVEVYTIEAASLEEATAQIEPPENWFSYDYECDIKTDADADVETITAVNVQINVTIRLPRWSGAGWENALPQEQAEWREQLGVFDVYHAETDETGELPANVLLGPLWDNVPDALKTGWLDMQQERQTHEAGHTDLARRRAMVLQQRLLNRPINEFPPIYDQFKQDLLVEEAAYNHHRQVGEETPAAPDKNTLVQ